MKSTFAIAMPIMAAAGALANAHSHLHYMRADAVSGKPAEMPKANAATPQGCYSSKANYTQVPVDVQFLSSGKCTPACKDKKFTVAALSPQACYCGMTYPAKADVVDDKNCNYPCNGYGLEACGGIKDAYSIFNIGIDLTPDYYDEALSSSASASPTSSSSPSVSTAVVTQTDSRQNQKPEKSGGGPNTAAIAAGVVVGVVVAAAIIGGIIFFIRRKRNAEIEEEHRRNAAVNAFISGSKPPSTSGGISITDSRLDPVMAHRRLSDGSIADNQDYSRKILRVTNA